MKKLQDAIETRGRVISSEVLKTDTFLNHAIDTELMDEIGQAFARAFEPGLLKRKASQKS